MRRTSWVLANGFALLVLFYGLQRFGLEYLKPYPRVWLGLTVFQVTCAGLVVYAVLMLRPVRLPDAQPA
jgi:hypothetical protein